MQLQVESGESAGWWLKALSRGSGPRSSEWAAERNCRGRGAPRIPTHNGEVALLAFQRRSKRTLDNSAFPIRIKVRCPYPLFDDQPSLISVWLHNTVGRGNYAQHVSETLPAGEGAFYFRHMEHALALLKTFPEMELADSVGEHCLTAR